MANRRSFRKRQSVREDSLNTSAGFPSESRLLSSASSEETRDGKLSVSVRPEKVARAKRLAQDENYPPRKVIESVAHLLAKHLERGDER